MFPETGRILDVIPIPELHELIGVVNKLFSETCKLFPQCWEWPQSWYLTVSDYHQQYEGNECKKLISNTGRLYQLIDRDFRASSRNDVVKHNRARLIQFAQTFERFNVLVHKTFGSRLQEGWQEALSSFRSSYSKLGISVTPKVHIIFVHLEPFLAEHGCGLGKFSEQAFESVHADFKNTLVKYTVKDPSNPSCIEFIRKAVLEYNAQHL
jgi:hypothetical protein